MMNLKKWLTDNCHSQVWLAERMNLSKGFVSMLVAGKKKPSLELALRIRYLTGGAIGLREWFAADEILHLTTEPICPAVSVDACFSRVSEEVL